MKKRIIATIALSLVFCIVFLGIKYTLIPRQMQNANFGTQSLFGKEETIDKLFIGSSMFRQGIDALSLADNNETSFLLSFNGNQPYYELIELKNIVESGTKIKTVYVDMYAYSLNAPVWLSDSRLILGKNIPFIISLYDGMKAYGSASLSELYQLIISENNELVATWQISFPLINSRYNHGGATGTSKGSTAEALEATKIHNESTVDEIQKQSISEINAYCDENKIELVFLETPKYFLQANEAGYISIMSQYSDILKRENVRCILSERTAKNIHANTNDGTTIYSFDDTNPDFYTDLIHLSSNGRHAFTQAIKDLV